VIAEDIADDPTLFLGLDRLGVSNLHPG